MDSLTLDIIKNFANLNQGLIFEEGTKLRTMSQNKTIFAEAEVPDNFPKEFAVYNLNELLGVISLFEKPEIDYGDDYMTIKEGKSKVRYMYSSPATVVAPPKDKKIPVRDPQLEFKLTKSDIQSVLKAANVLKSTHLLFDQRGITTVNRKGSTNNNYFLKIEDMNGSTDEVFSLKVESLKMIPSDYAVTVTAKNVRFSGDGIEYIIAVDAGDE